MLDGYRKHSNGVIEKIDKTHIEYTEDYTSNYDVYPSTLSFSRLGYLISKLGQIPSSLLDVGYGNGDFLNQAKKVIAKCFGYDVANTNTPLGCEKVFDLKDYYEIICFFDSLEHFEDIDFVSDLNCKYIYISVPSCNFGEDDEWFEKWKHRKPSEHIWHFDETSLITFMKSKGFTLVDELSNFEDVIRVDKRYSPNIITGLFKKN